MKKRRRIAAHRLPQATKTMTMEGPSQELLLKGTYPAIYRAAIAAAAKDLL